MVKQHVLPNGVIHEARAEDVYPLISAGSVSLVHSDGPYAVAKAKWDMMKVADLAAWYRPHIEAWGCLCAPSASIYHWGTAEGWAAVHPEYLRQGWTFQCLIVWNKVTPPLTLPSESFPDVSEVCGLYTRGDQKLTHPDHNPRRHEGAHVAAVTNVWTLAPGAYISEKLKAPVKGLARDGSLVFPSLHPCQKPLKFADRIVRASSRPGQIILEPFGGTCRIAVACEQIAPLQASRRKALYLRRDECGWG